MAPRINLQRELEALIGNRNVYFQPPESIKLSYPCIVYHKSDWNSSYADNRLYNLDNKYKVTVIDANPDTDLPDKLAYHFETCRLENSFTHDGLYHYVLSLYY